MTPEISLTPATVDRTRTRLARRGDHVVPLINRVRRDLGEVFDAEVDTVDTEAYRREMAAVMAEGDRAVNVTGLVLSLEALDVEGDYPGFIVDEFLGRELAATIAGEQPLRMLAEATFHFADATHHREGAAAGEDDLDAAIAAGLQTRLPGWPWREAPSPYAP